MLGKLFEPEEWIGSIWHRYITRAATSHYPEAAVELQQVRHFIGVIFRALGGDRGLDVEATSATSHTARRGMLQRLAGTDNTIELAWSDEQSLRLPEVIDLFARRELNRDLYIWLAALAVGKTDVEEPWLVSNQRLTVDILNRYPGLARRYHALVEAFLAQRPSAEALPEDEREQELAIRRALLHPGSVKTLPQAPRPPHPVSLWLHPFPPIMDSIDAVAGDDGGAGEGDKKKVKELDKERRHRAEQVEEPESEDRGLITVRMENILTWGEFIKLDRSTDESEDLEEAADALDDMDQISVSRNTKGSAGGLRFDLDLPSRAQDDQPLSGEVVLPEWDYRKKLLQSDHCRLVVMDPRECEEADLPKHLRSSAGKLRAQFQHLAPARVWRRQLSDGTELDLDACVRYASDRAAGMVVAADGLYRDLRVGERDLSSLLLADLSLSTDSWVDNHTRVIEVIRDALFLFAESLSATGDPFAIYGFSSRNRDHVRYNRIKPFSETYNGQIRGRIGAIKPGYYTRMGAAIRYSTQLLSERGEKRKLLLILTDGKPNDLDKYEGRYGIEDTRQAIREARSEGLSPFCVTIDKRGNDYLPYLFGSCGYVVVRNHSQLPKKLPQLYANLTA